jgi:DnaK suppressor protein
VPQLDLERIAHQLREEKAKLLVNTEKGREAERAAGAQTFADEADLAVSALSQSVSTRLRDRERSLLLKIEQALARIADGSFGICDGCEERIEPRRLEARPMADLCIRCKEAQEREERGHA